MSYLSRILETKRRELRAAAPEMDLAQLQASIEPCTTDVLAALRGGQGLSFIAEHKRRSPSRGAIRPKSNAAEVARSYEAAGAAAISVLTDRRHFDGGPEDLVAVRAAVSIPVLRKDFILSPLQVMEARAWGADMLLLIVAALSQPELHQLLRMTERLGMTPLVEVHDEHELKQALDAGAKLIGVNNRNLHTFTVDLEVSEELAAKCPSSIVRVSESGISDRDDLSRIEAAGYDAVLIGEGLMRAKDPGQALRKLME